MWATEKKLTVHPRFTVHPILSGESRVFLYRVSTLVADLFVELEPDGYVGKASSAGKDNREGSSVFYCLTSALALIYIAVSQPKHT